MQRGKIFIQFSEIVLMQYEQFSVPQLAPNIGNYLEEKNFILIEY